MDTNKEQTNKDEKSFLGFLEYFGVSKKKIDLFSRRLKGDYHVDEWGLDEELVEEFRPIFQFIYRKYWRIKATGLENVPSEGRALLVSNHSGIVAFDGAMVAMAIQEEHPHPRILRCLYLSLFAGMPFTGTALARIGQVQAMPQNAEKLLNQDHLVGVFPEGLKGIGKLYKDRYRLARFGRGGFVSIALKTQSPIIPVSIVGAEEIYPHLHNFKPMASLLGVPYFPITPIFPWLGPIGLLPLPSKWHIHFDKPIPIPDMFYRPSEEPLMVSNITNLVRDVIQKNIYRLLKDRNSVFF